MSINFTYNTTNHILYTILIRNVIHTQYYIWTHIQCETIHMYYIIVLFNIELDSNLKRALQSGKVIKRLKSNFKDAYDNRRNCSENKSYQMKIITCEYNVHYWSLALYSNIKSTIIQAPPNNFFFWKIL